jgi:Tol biopolymer transport system component
MLCRFPILIFVCLLSSKAFDRTITASGDASDNASHNTSHNTSDDTSTIARHHAEQGHARKVLARAALTFEENRGQADSDVRYLARGAGYGVALREDRVTFTLRRHTSDVSLRLTGSRQPSRIVGLEPQPGLSHYFRGADPSRWIRDVPHVARVRYESVYPGIDVVFYGNQRQMEFDFIVAPHADAAAIGLEFSGVMDLRLNEAGDLILGTADGELIQRAPVAYQQRDGDRLAVDSRYVVDGNVVRIDVGPYDRERPLIIDPIFDYSTYLGGTRSDNVVAMKVDLNHILHVAGHTASLDFPGRGVAGERGFDIFVTRFSPTGTLMSSTVIGGESNDHVEAIAVDRVGAAYLVGDTTSSYFPTTGSVFGQYPNEGIDAYATKVGLKGELVYSTFLNSAGNDVARAAAVTTSGELIVAGETNSAGFPRTHGNPHAGNFDVFVMRLNGSASAYRSILLGGSLNDYAEGLALHLDGDITVAGDTQSSNFPIGDVDLVFDASFNGVEDVFVARLNSDLQREVSTFLGGSGEEKARSVAVQGNDTYVTGYTLSSNFPMTGGVDGQAMDLFVVKFGPSYQTSPYRMTFGGSGNDVAYAVEVDARGSAYVVGDTTSPNFPRVSPFDAQLNGVVDALVLKLDPLGQLVYSTYLGGPGNDQALGLALDGTTLWVGGTTGGNFPIAGNPMDPSYNGNSDGFIARFSDFQEGESHLLTVTRQGNGTITSAPAGISCGTDCTQSYLHGTGVTLTATASPGWSFTGWKGCDTANAATCNLTMNDARTVAAVFTAVPQPPTITSITPAVGSTAGRTPVVITGQNLANASVTIAGVAVSGLNTQATTLSFVTPARASAGPAPLLVTTAQGTVSREFTYAPVTETTVKGADRPAFNFDGRWMAFESRSALLESDTNGYPDIYVRDRDTGRVIRVSISSAGAQSLGGPSLRPAISATGRFVAFESTATNLVPDDTNHASDIFLHDRDPDENDIFDETAPGRRPLTFRVNLGLATTDQPGGAQALGGDSKAPSVSGNGRWIAFESAATNLVADDSNQRSDVFVHDALLARTVRVSVSSTSAQAINGHSTAADISLNGRFVAFQSEASNLVPNDANNVVDVFVRDRDSDADAVFDETGAVATTRISVATGGAEAVGGASTEPSISGDGRLIAFTSAATNLAPGDTNNVSDVFLHDRSNGTTSRRSLHPTSLLQFVGRSYAPAISDNGRVLIFSVADIATIPAVGASQTESTQLGGTYRQPGVDQGSGPEEGTLDQTEPGEEPGESGISGDASTTGVVSEEPSEGPSIDIRDESDEQSAGGDDPPFIAGLTPNAASTGGSVEVEITGGNFTNDARVDWGGQDLPPTPGSLTADRLRVNVPAQTVPGQVNVFIRAGGRSSDSLPFTYRTGVSTPRITSVDPQTGSTEGGTTVTILGTGFVQGATVVRFRGRVAVLTASTTTSLTVTTPEHLVGPAPVVLTNPDNGEAIADAQFVYVMPPPLMPIITSLMPSQGFRQVTTAITVHGEDRSFAEGTTATVGGILAPVSFYSDSIIVVEAQPAEQAPPTVPLRVTVPGAGSAEAQFNYSPVPHPFQGSSTDTDADGMSDNFESAFGLDPNNPSDAAGDPDSDGRTNLQEAGAQSHPVGVYTRYLAEGAANTFFKARIAIANPNTTAAIVLVHFQRDTPQPGEPATVTYFAVVPPLARTIVDPLSPNVGVPPGSFATVVESDVELAVDRSMFWDTAGYSAHSETSLASPATTWYLAEGATNPIFELFYLLQNPDLTRTADVMIRYLRSDGDPIEIAYTVPPQGRRTIPVKGEHPGLAQADISSVVTSTNGVPIIVERAMYASFPGQRPFEAGHDSAGITSPSTEWFLAEGATGPFFEMFVLYANPNASDATVETTYLLSDGTTIPKTHTVAANRRLTIPVATEDPRLVSATPSIRIRSTNGVSIIVERAMWWPSGGPWIEAHNSAASTATGTRWAVADGEVGPPPANAQTFLLIGNTSTVSGNVRVTLLFEDGTPAVAREFTVLPESRRTLWLFEDMPEARGKGFGAVVESLIDPATGVAAQIVVERAMYFDTPGQIWGAGTNALATRLR